MRKPPIALIGAAFVASFAIPAAAHGSQATTPSDCHPAYATPPCVPIDAGDVDCEGGKGDGPVYVQGPVEVKDPDVDPYRLDDNKDGIGCEDGNEPSTPDPVEPTAPPTTKKSTSTAVKATPKFTG